MSGTYFACTFAWNQFPPQHFLEQVLWTDPLTGALLSSASFLGGQHFLVQVLEGLQLEAVSGTEAEVITETVGPFLSPSPSCSLDGPQHCLAHVFWGGEGDFPFTSSPSM